MPSPTSRRNSNVVANNSTENIHGHSSESGPSLAWIFPGEKIMQSAAIWTRLLRRTVLGHDVIAYIADCSLKHAVTQNWNKFVRAAGRTSSTVDHQQDVGRSRSDTQIESS
jgi:hypothetical protein